MNWFNILKNAGLAQRQRQGISARQKDEEFIFEDEDDDCYQKLISFLRSRGLQGPEMGKGSRGSTARGPGEIIELHVESYIKENPTTIATIFYDKGTKPPDEIWCNVLSIIYHEIKGTIDWDRKEGGPPTGYSPTPDYYISRGEEWSEGWGSGNLNGVIYVIEYKRRTVFEYEIRNPVQVKGGQT